MSTELFLLLYDHRVTTNSLCQFLERLYNIGIQFFLHHLDLEDIYIYGVFSEYLILMSELQCTYKRYAN